MAKDKKKKKKKLSEEVKVSKKKKLKNKKNNIKKKKSAKQNKSTKIERQQTYETFNKVMQLAGNLNSEPIIYDGNAVHNAEIKALQTIDENEPISTADLAIKLGVTRSAVLKTTNKLVHKDLIEKSKSQTNGRILEITLTDKGRKLVEEADKLCANRIEPIMKSLENMNEKELAYFNTALERILMNIIR